MSRATAIVPPEPRRPRTGAPRALARPIASAAARGLALALLVAGSVGCGPYLSALTPPPPTLQAELDPMRDSVELSVGVALAFRCTSWEGLPCRSAKISSQDPAIADAAPAHLNHLAPVWPQFPAVMQGPRPETGFVVYGRGAGTTRLRLTSADGDLDIDVRVVP